MTHDSLKVRLLSYCHTELCCFHLQVVVTWNHESLKVQCNYTTHNGFTFYTRIKNVYLTDVINFDIIQSMQQQFTLLAFFMK